jgi:hypothetical protein
MDCAILTHLIRYRITFLGPRQKEPSKHAWDGWDGSWDGLGRTLGRIKHAKSSMFTGLGTVGRIIWGRKLSPKSEARNQKSEGHPSAKMAHFQRGKTEMRDL